MESPWTDKEVRAAKVANALAAATRQGLVEAPDALRILRHELRRLNTGDKLKIPVRSEEAQAVIDKYEKRGQAPPNNNSDEALHADHVWRLTGAHLKATQTVDDWLTLLRKLATVVCVTAAENYMLTRFEKSVDGPSKYVEAGITWTDPSTAPWDGSPELTDSGSEPNRP